MRGRRSSRSAAVVLAGCVGLAVMAPGLALAAPVPDLTTQDACEAAHYTWTAVGCDDTTTTTTTATTTSDATVDGGAGAGAGDAGNTGSTGSSTSNSSSSSASDSAARTQRRSAVTAQQNTDGARIDTNAPGTNTSEDAVVTPEAATEGGQQLITQLAAAAPAGITVPPLPDNFLPGAGSLADLLGTLPVPTEVPEGGFTNPQQACAFLVGGLPIEGTPEQLATLGTALSGFCTSLPTSFTGLDLDDLLGFLRDLLGNLPTTGTGSGVIPDQAPHTVPAQYWGYWNHHYDVDCPDLTYDEANAILAGDPSDPFRLDGDHDGEACEQNAHGDAVAYADYVGYPEGGVSTGDGSTDTSGASGVEVALAATTLSGLGLTGLVLVRRFARQG